MALYNAALEPSAGNPIPIKPQSILPTYVANAVGVTPPPTGGFFTLYGSDTKTVAVLRIYANGSTSGSQSQRVIVQAVKRSSVNTGGTSILLTAVPNDPLFSAATAQALAWTAAPTAGTLVGVLAAGPLVTLTSTPASANPVSSEVAFPIAPATPLILRGASESIGLTTADTWNAGTLNIGVVWCEFLWGLINVRNSWHTGHNKTKIHRPQ